MWSLARKIMPTPAQHALLAQLAARLEAARHGERGVLVQAAADGMGVTSATVHRWLKEGDHRYAPRKRRSDAGKLSLTREEAFKIAAMLVRGYRANDKKVTNLTDAVEVARRNGWIRAERVDEKTGAITPLSISSIASALKHYGVSPTEMRQSAPYQPLASEYPNQCWQVDASVCILYYLPLAGEGAGGYGIARLDKAVHYKNKPENMKAVERFRIIRYVATDHASGVIRVRYYPHAESGDHTVAFLAWLMSPKGNRADPFHGRPDLVMVDPGATSSGMVRRFCDAMGISLIVNRPHNPRAKGQVEQANNLWEMKFEGWLDHVRDRVNDFNDLNALAETFQLWFNANAIHSRTQKTRFAAWMEITPEQLKTTAPESQLLKLATGRPETPKIAGDLTVRFADRKWDVRHVPGIVIGRKLKVCLSPFTEGGAMALLEQTAEDGGQKTVQYPLEAVETGAFGFPTTAAKVGQEYKSPPETLAVANARELDRLITGEATQDAAEAAMRKKGFVPFGGKINPYIAAETDPGITFLPRAGTPMEPSNIETADRVIEAVDACFTLRERLGDAWQPEMFEWYSRRFAGGITESALERLIENLKQESGGRYQVSGG